MKKLIVFLFAFCFVVAGEYAAVVDGITIDLKTFDKVYQSTLDEYKRNLLIGKETNLNAQELEALKYSALDPLIDNILINNYAKKEKITVSDAEVQKKLKDIQKGFPSEEEFWKTLEIKNIGATRLQENLRQQLLREKVVLHIYPSFNQVSTEDILCYLKKNMLLNFPLQYNMVIMVTDNYAYLDELKDLKGILKSWKSLALNPEKSNPSLLISEEDIAVPVLETISELEINQLSKVGTLEDGQFFKVAINKIENMPDFDLQTISKTARNSLLEERRNRYYQDWISEQKSKSNILINKTLFPNYYDRVNNESPYINDMSIEILL